MIRDDRSSVFSRSMYFTDIMAIVSAVFSSYFLLFVTFGPTSPASQYVVYTVSGHSHTLDMGMHCIRDRRPVRCASAGRDVTSIVAALHAFWPVDVQRGVCVL